MNNNLDNLFDEEPIVVDITKEQEEILDLYISKFGHGVPQAYIPKNYPKEKLYQCLKKCVETEKDELLELLNIQIDPRRIY